MSKRTEFLRDRFTFSLRGMTATASFFIMPVVADDGINEALDRKFKEKAAEKPADTVAGNLICQQS